MILFDPTLENFVDGVDFSANDCCTWVVYPPGCAGDLLASILNFHYVQTGARFKGITEKGQIIFRPSDMKYTNQLQYLRQVNDEIFNDVKHFVTSSRTYGIAPFSSKSFATSTLLTETA